MNFKRLFSAVSIWCCLCAGPGFFDMAIGEEAFQPKNEKSLDRISICQKSIDEDLNHNNNGCSMGNMLALLSPDSTKCGPAHKTCSNKPVPSPPILDAQAVHTTLLSLIDTLREDDSAFKNLDLSCDPHWLRYFYMFENRHLLWMDDHGLTDNAKALVHLLNQAEFQGLTPSAYHVAAIADFSKKTAVFPTVQKDDVTDQAAQCELLLTDAFFLYGFHLSEGRLNPENYDFGWHIPKPEKHLSDTFYHILHHGKMKQYVQLLEPRHPGYLKLKKALNDHLQIKASGGWQPVPPGKKLKLGACSKRVTALKKRLIISGDLAPDRQGRFDYFDNQLEDALKRFQHRHGLKVDGIAGKKTIAVLNVPVEDRITRIALNMERWRWLPESLGRSYIMVNAAGFQIQVVENQQTVKTIRAIVGKADRPTPILSNRITYMELNPYWNIPHAIAINDILPRIHNNPDYLANNHIQVFKNWRNGAEELNPGDIDWATVNEQNFHFKLRQEPAKNNALGQVKFMFPNKFSVYMHDTPSTYLFNRYQRTFSSGCVRIENPIELAEYLLTKDSKETNENILGDIRSRERKILKLSDPVNIHILYWTAWVADDGTVHFREDVYGKDHQLNLALHRQGDAYQVAAILKDGKSVLSNQQTL